MVFIGIAALDLIFTFFALCFLALGVSQVVIPAWEGLPLFPYFRKKGTLEGELVRARGDLQAKELEREVKAVRAKVDNE